jgi:hypothetical protein
MFSLIGIGERSCLGKILTPLQPDYIYLSPSVSATRLAYIFVKFNSRRYYKCGLPKNGCEGVPPFPTDDLELIGVGL